MNKVFNLFPTYKQMSEAKKKCYCKVKLQSHSQESTNARFADETGLILYNKLMDLLGKANINKFEQAKVN